MPDMSDCGWEEFDCPKCAPMALKDAIAFSPEVRAKMVAKLQRERDELARLNDRLNARPVDWAPGVLMQEGDVGRRAAQFRASKTVREVREVREGARDRFSGLDLFQDDGGDPSGGASSRCSSSSI
jgi:hypothetical protein